MGLGWLYPQDAAQPSGCATFQYGTNSFRRLLQLENERHKSRYFSSTFVETPRRQVIAMWDNLGNIPTLCHHDRSREPCRIFRTGEACLLGTSFHTGECNRIKSISSGVRGGGGRWGDGMGHGHTDGQDGTALPCQANLKPLPSAGSRWALSSNTISHCL